MILTKIILTLGPSLSNADALRRVFEAGADVVRLNFSHGTLDQHARLLEQARQNAEAATHPLGIVGDLCGPKVRVGEVADDGSGGMHINAGESLIIQRATITGADGRVSINTPRVIDDVQIGQRVLIDDGMLRLLVTHKTDDVLGCQCLTTGVIRSHKGVNLPDTRLALPSITAHDWSCVDWAIENDLDFLALSFVRSADELHELRRYLDNRNSNIHLIAKIEKPEALEHIDAIIHTADALMVARGDLGVEMDVAQVPVLQKDIIRRCRDAGKPVIVATQMLQSMIDLTTPTRAEVSDVANAIYDEADALMLSGETAIGRNPPLVVHTMNHIAEVTESYLAQHDRLSSDRLARVEIGRQYAAIARGVWQLARELKIRLVVVWSQSGRSARVFSKLRFPVPILSLSSDVQVVRRMSIQYGIMAQVMDVPADVNELVEHVDTMLRHRGQAAPGDRVVVIGSTTLGTPGAANTVMVHTIGDDGPAERIDVE